MGDQPQKSNHSGREENPLWVFAYGSLMWDPGFEVAETRPARVHGWHRRFSLKSVHGWGRPEAPGLIAALHRGGSVRGRALRVAQARRAETSRYLRHRESAYRHVRVNARIGHGRIVSAVTFVFDPACPRYDLTLTPAAACQLIRQGRGARGSSADYLENVARILAEDGQEAGQAGHLWNAVRNEVRARTSLPVGPTRRCRP